MKANKMELRYAETHKTWDKIAQLYADRFMDLSLYDDTYQKFCELISKPDASVLEIGCGPGNITRHMLEAYPKLKILATDISSNMLDLAQKNNPSIETKVMDCRNIALLKDSFDAVVCGFTIPYLSKVDCSSLIAEISRLLTPSGVLYLSFVAGDYNNSTYISGSTGDRTYFYYYELAQLKKEMKSCGMDVIDVLEKEYEKFVGDYELHTIIYAQKQ